MKRSLFFTICLVTALGTPKLLAAEAPQPQAQVSSIEQAAPVCNSVSTAKNPLDLLNPVAPVQSALSCCQEARIACREDCAPCHFVFVCAVHNCDADCECTC